MNPFSTLSKKELALWLLSISIVGLSNILSGDFNLLTLAAALVGVTAVLFQAKGNIWGQILVTAFALFYGLISWQFRYWGELLTYVGMSLPMALWATYTWATHPSETNADEVEIRRLNRSHYGILILSGAAVTYGFYLLLSYLDTPNLLFSTISITTSFYAAALTMLRSSYYAFWYALNDLVLIILWVLATLTDPVYLPMVVNFMVFFLNDIYGFYSWKRREKTQLSAK